MIKQLLRPAFFIYKRNKEFRRFKKILSQQEGKALKVVVGSSDIFEAGWIPSEWHFLNLLKPQEWLTFFKEDSISTILAEHVWEHLTPEEGKIAVSTCYRFLKKGGRLRIAVPDGLHADPVYIEHVKPGGTGAGADDHKILYTYKIMTNVLEEAGYTVQLLEYFDEAGVFHQHTWDAKEGYIHRSIKNDKRNADGKPNYTSLIVDAIK
jgi:predicted SAM-dependent methyltransferase